MLVRHARPARNGDAESGAQILHFPNPSSLLEIDRQTRALHELIYSDAPSTSRRCAWARLVRLRNARLALVGVPEGWARNG